MAAAPSRRPVLLAVGLAILVIGAVAVINRDAIADRLLRGGDTTLSDEAARGSEQAAVALAFLEAYRTLDMEAVGRVAAPEYTAVLQAGKDQASPEFEQMRATALEDLLADPAGVRDRIKSVQVHGDRAVVLAETASNSWFVQLAGKRGAWKVIGF